MAKSDRLHASCSEKGTPARLTLTLWLSHHPENLMLFKTRSASVYGIEAHLVDVEVNLTAGTNGEYFTSSACPTLLFASPAVASLPRFATMVSHFLTRTSRSISHRRISRRKARPSIFPWPWRFSAEWACCSAQDLSDFLLVGELSLDGKLRPVRGVLSIAMLAREKKIPCLIVAAGNAREAAVVGGIEVHPMRTITEVVDFLNGNRSPSRFTSNPSSPRMVSHRVAKTFATSADSFMPSARSKSPWPADTTC